MHRSNYKKEQNEINLLADTNEVCSPEKKQARLLGKIGIALFEIAYELQRKNYDKSKV